jgi:flagellar basal-body rod modification protein FlgD
LSISGVNRSYYSADSGRAGGASNEDSKLFNQILNNAKESLSEDISQIVIKLEPSSLGNLSIKVSVEGGITVARFGTENKVVKDVLNDHLEELKHMLNEKGFLVKKVVVGLESDDDESNVEIVNQISENIKNSLSKKTPEMVIKMKPESLGELSIKVYEKDGVEYSEFLADSHIVKNAVYSDFDNIKKALKEKGFDIQRYVVSVKSKDDGSEGNENANVEEDKDPNKMDKDLFMKLLVAQMANQDPLNPMEDREFIAQMAQFSSLEQMQEVNKNVQLNNIILDKINEALNGQSKNVNEGLYHINNGLDKLTKDIKGLNDNQNESLNKDKEVINQLININKAIKGYGDNS